MGRLTKDPEVRYTQTTNTLVASFTLAVNRRFVRQGEEKQADFINVTAFNQQAEFVAKYFKKGNMIGIEGSIRTNRYTDKNGNNRTSFEVVVNNVQFVESKRDAAASTVSDSAPAPSFSNAGANDFADLGDISDDDLPF